PGKSQPEAAIVSVASEQADGSDQLVRVSFQPKRPRPFVATFDVRKHNVAIIRVSAIWRIRPGHDFSEITNDLPLRKQNLSLASIGQLQRAQDKTWSFKGSHLAPFTHSRFSKP